MFQTPILFIIFNRPDSTQKVFNEIKKQRPQKLYVFADGPRFDILNDVSKCKESRKIIENQVDWECNLFTCFEELNLGCGKGPAKAITWFFNNVEEGIIIEDDCIPHPDFFQYCSILLEKYRFEEKIMVIGATSYDDFYKSKYSYTFTLYSTMAAWATWRRVWLLYDYYLSFVNRKNLQLKLEQHFYSKFEVKNWMRLYDWMIKDNFSDYWDWQLHFLLFYHKGISIRPQKNMISNIGVGEGATHTKYISSEIFLAFKETFGCLPLNHPPEIEVNKRRDSIHKRIKERRVSYSKSINLLKKFFLNLGFRVGIINY